MVHLVNWWDGDSGAFSNFIKYCGSQYSNFDDNKIYIYSLFGPFDKLKENIDGIKLYFTGENTKQRFIEYKNEEEISKYVDIICGFFKTTEKSVRIPLWCFYYDLYKNGLFTPKEVPDRKLAATLIARHDMYNNRVPIVYDFLQKKIPVISTLPIQGTFGIKIGPEPNDKVEFIKNFYFNICPENTIEDGYTTEKIFQCIEAGCIPIYNNNNPVEKGILNQNRIFNTITEELIKKSEIIQKMDIWDKEALPNVFLMYLELWIKIKKEYEKKYGKCILNENVLKNAIIYNLEEKNTEEFINIIKNHWVKYNQLFKPLALIKVKDVLYSIEDIFENNF
jgi:hypothetical protein